jgi:hypothetical protein
LCGIGGKTVEEAKQNISYAEFVDWCRYRAKWGSLNLGMRVDRAVAHAMRLYFNAHSKTANLKHPDLSPFDEAARRGVDVDSPDEMFALLSSLARKN